MRILLIHNTASELEAWHIAIRPVFPDAELAFFSDPLLALKDCMRAVPDRVFVACALRPLDGFGVLRMLRQRFPQVPVCMIGETESNRRDAGKALADGFMLSPVTQEKTRLFERALERLSMETVG